MYLYDDVFYVHEGGYKCPQVKIDASTDKRFLDMKKTIIETKKVGLRVEVGAAFTEHNYGVIRNWTLKDFNGFKFSIDSAYVINSQFENCEFRGCVPIDFSKFEKCIFTSCVFGDWIRHSKFTKCKFINCIFEKDCYIHNIKIKDCKFEGSIMYSRTIEGYFNGLRVNTVRLEANDTPKIKKLKEQGLLITHRY